MDFHPKNAGQLQAFFEKNVQLLSSALANLAEEQQKMATWWVRIGYTENFHPRFE